MTAREVAQAAMDRLKITVDAVFVPWSKSRNAGVRPSLNDYSLNWKVTVKRDVRDVLTTDYSAGIGHCPAHKNVVGLKSSIYNTEVIVWECEHGKEARRLNNLGLISPRFVACVRDGHPANKPVLLLPDPVNVMHSLVTDADALNYAGFEDWASSFGYDTDSRKAEATYNACMKLALQMRVGLGDTGLSELTEAFREY